MIGKSDNARRRSINAGRWTRRPPNYYQNASKNTRKLWEHPGKILFVSIQTSQIFENVRKNVCPRYQLLFRLFFDFTRFFVKMKLYLKPNFTEMRIGKWLIFHTKQDKNLDMNFISIKKHEQQITLNFFIFKDGTLNFFIFKKGNHPTLNSR